MKNPPRKLQSGPWHCRQFRSGLRSLVGWTILAIGSLLQAQTLTDAFASRPIATGVSAEFTGVSTGATIEVGEPDHDAARHRSLWGAWTAPDNGTVTITTNGSSFDTVLAVYTGTLLSALAPVAYNNNVQSGFVWSSVSFPTKAGVTYSFAVDGYPNNPAGQGSAVAKVLFISAAQPGSEVGSNLFATRPTLPSGLQAIGVGDNRTASIEVDEPAGVGARNRTLWWRWVSPSNGVVSIDTLASAFDTALTVYTGDSLAALSEVAINNNALNVVQSRVDFQTRAGQEYQIMVDGYPNNNAGQGNVMLNLNLQPNSEPGGVPGANGFDNRALLAGNRARGIANNTFFSLEFNEPDHGSNRRHTVWWHWTAPANGLAKIRTEGSDFDTFLAVYTGGSYPELKPVAANNNGANVVWSEVQFMARKGVDYQIMVDGAPNNPAGDGNISLSINQGAAAPEPVALKPTTYYGLIHSNLSSKAAAGFMRLTFNKAGGLSFAATLGGRRALGKGNIGQGGNGSVQTTDRAYSVAFVFDPQARHFNGTVRQGQSVVGTFTAKPPKYHATKNPASSLAGRHTALLLGDPRNPNLPPGAGYGMVSVNSAGIVGFMGVLANGIKVSQSVPLLEGDIWPLYAQSKNGADIVLGPVHFDHALEESDFSGRLTWFGSSFAGNTDVVGSRYAAAPPLVNFSSVSPAGNALLTFSGGTLATPLKQPLNIAIRPLGSAVSPFLPKFRFSINPRTGLFTGSFAEDASARAIKFAGTILQKTGYGAGCFRVESEGFGSMELNPQQ